MGLEVQSPQALLKKGGEFTIDRREQCGAREPKDLLQRSVTTSERQTEPLESIC